MHEVNQRRLRYFFEVITHGSIRRAADKINTAPSVITRQIRLLEAELGVSLFDRGAGGAIPTEAAQYVLEYWRSCKAHQSDLEERLSELNDFKRGQINIALGEGFIDDLMDNVLSRFTRAFPSISFTINVMTANDVVTQVGQDLAHVGIAFNVPTSARIRPVLSTKLPLYLLIGAEHPLASETEPISIGQALAYPVAVMPTAFGIGKILETVAFLEERQLNVALETNSVHSLARFVRDNRAVTFLGAQNAMSEARGGGVVYRRVEHPLLVGSNAQVFVNAGRTPTMATRKLMDYVQTHSEIFGDPALGSALHHAATDELRGTRVTYRPG